MQKLEQLHTELILSFIRNPKTKLHKQLLSSYVVEHPLDIYLCVPFISPYLDEFSRFFIVGTTVIYLWVAHIDFWNYSA